MVAQAGLGFDVGGGLLFLVLLGLGISAVGIAVAAGVFGTQAFLLKGPASRFFQVAVACLVAGGGFLALAFRPW